MMKLLCHLPCCWAAPTYQPACRQHRYYMNIIWFSVTGADTEIGIVFTRSDLQQYSAAVSDRSYGDPGVVGGTLGVILGIGSLLCHPALFAVGKR